MIIVYLGPSLPVEKARQILEADYRPPISREDLKKALKDRAKIIGIIDGVFYNKTAVAHKEIIEVMKKGVIVVGGSSMGALRASELDTFGMIGAGRIYECYKSGRICADDEVAVTFNPVTGEQMSEPLVNIRYQLKAAQDSGIITAEERDSLLKTCTGMFYPDRKYPEILKRATEKGIISTERSDRLGDFIRDNPLNLKAEDAIRTLEKIKEIIERSKK
ncbi:TfuA-related McrA-glycine thioamidation protein [Methanocella sp. CWC-04]|uniref:TfuA-related McrA-glycine thioamidation protein n=1 Tax=Methanooceanicella nereidis TaxID=2052831 RepID=A0AAP2RG62_9EURY|nr:TfuA-related McrA-glycine thioamidation protein [Methanocella sp. CWC-04]MCD1296181.1 TfuA-related McrA-glycine thioamidation protein [Methanocella sp. CWC-04]